MTNILEMLPSMGYFTNIPCPFFNSGLCERPHCHFRHMKKDDDINSLIPCLSHSQLPNENILNNLISQSMNNPLRTNLPTEGESTITSDLVLSQNIIFQETGDISQNLLKTDSNDSNTKMERQIGKHFLPTANVPSYKPTPISELQKKNFLNNNLFLRQNINSSKLNDYYPTSGFKRPKLDNGLEYNPESSKICGSSSLQYSPDPHNSVPNNLYTPTIITSVSPPPVDYIPTKSQYLPTKEPIQTNLIKNIDLDNPEIEKKKESNDNKFENKSLGKEKEGKENSKNQDSSSNKHKDKEKSHHISNRTKSSKRKKEKEKQTKSSSKDSKHKSSKSSHVKSNKSSEKEKSSHSSHKSKKDTDLKKDIKHNKKKSHSESKTKHKQEKQKCKDVSNKEKNKSLSKVLQPKKSEVSESEFDSDWNEEEINEECFRIFQEFNSNNEDKNKIEDKSIETIESISQDLPVPVTTAKVRIAHQPNTNSQVFRNPIARRPLINPSKAMIDRLLKAKSKPEGESQNSGKIRIAHVPNVSLLLNAKNKINLSVNLNRSTNTTNTIAQSAPKTGRIAHTPSNDILKKCIIIGSSRIPVNNRQRYLEILVKEYLKICANEDEAIDKAKAEESLIYNRSSTKNIYSSLMTNCISKLRKENSIKSDDNEASTSRNLTSHNSILQGKNGQRVSWSIIKNKKPSVVDLYEALKKYKLSQDDLNLYGYPRPHPSIEGCAYISEQSTPKILSNLDSRERTCDRCRKNYLVNKNGMPISDSSCVYHWGRVFNQRAFGGGRESRYSCCQSEPNESGCCLASNHVSDMTDPRKMSGFVQTKSHSHIRKKDEPNVYALDCEMCYTSQGLELTRVSVVNTDLVTIYETLVKPSNPVLDYNTRFSGITEPDLRDVTTSIKEVQYKLLKIFSNKTILIGHSLESDFKSLKMIHDSVIDTSVVFPHKMGFPKKRSLKTLTREFLSKIIQENELGHDSAEDARAAMELMLWKIKEDLKSC